MKIAKKQYSTADKSALIQEWRNSNHSQSKFCRSKGLSITTFNNWVTKEKNKPQKDKFIPIKLASPKIEDTRLEYFKIKIKDKLEINLPSNVNEQLLSIIIREAIKCI